MPLQIVRNDITKMEVDVIVNAANTALQRAAEYAVPSSQLPGLTSCRRNVTASAAAR